MHTLEMRTDQRLPDCHQHVQEVLGHLSEYQLCMLFHPTRHHSHLCTNQRLPQVFIVIIFIPFILLIRVIPGNCIFDARCGLGESTQVEIVNCCYHCFRCPSFCISCCHRSITPLCAECFYNMRKFPAVANAFTSAPVVPLVANTDASSLEVKPDVSTSKIPRMFRAESPC